MQEVQQKSVGAGRLFLRAGDRCPQPRCFEGVLAESYDSTPALRGDWLECGSCFSQFKPLVLAPVTAEGEEADAMKPLADEIDFRFDGPRLLGASVLSKTTDKATGERHRWAIAQGVWPDGATCDCPAPGHCRHLALYDHLTVQLDALRSYLLDGQPSGVSVEFVTARSRRCPACGGDAVHATAYVSGRGYVAKTFHSTPKCHYALTITGTGVAR